MRRTIITLLLLAVVAWFFPPQAEDVVGQCRALESRALREQTLQTATGKEDPAHAAAVSRRVLEFARAQYDSLPPGLACAIAYWQLLTDSDLSIFQAEPTTAG